jgi:hypothetical protein
MALPTDFSYLKWPHWIDLLALWKEWQKPASLFQWLNAIKSELKMYLRMQIFFVIRFLLSRTETCDWSFFPSLHKHQSLFHAEHFNWIHFWLDLLHRSEIEFYSYLCGRLHSDLSYQSSQLVLLVFIFIIEYHQIEIFTSLKTVVIIKNNGLWAWSKSWWKYFVRYK